MELLVEVLFLLVILSLGLILRFIPHLRFYFPSTPDTFFTLNKIIDPEYEKEIVTYPKLLHQLFRFFLRQPEQATGRSLNRITPVFDIITSCVLYLFVRFLFGVELALLSTLIFTITPFVVKQGVTLSSRPLGLLFFTCSLLFLVLPFPLNWIAIFPVAFTLLSHRLSTQTLVAIYVVFTFVDWQVSLIFLAGFGLAVLLSKGHYIRILRNHISAIIKYARGEHYPNRRFTGVILVPTIGGFLMNLLFRWLPFMVPFPIVVFGITIFPPIPISAYFENLLLIWGTVCIFLLVFWVAGESYKYMYLPGAPFAIFSALLLQNSIVFQYILILLIASCLGLSLYFTLRFQHLPRNLISVLKKLQGIKGQVKFLIPDGYLRAGIYFSRKQGTKIALEKLTAEEFARRVEEQGSTHIVIDENHLELVKRFHPVAHSEQWHIFSVN